MFLEPGRFQRLGLGKGILLQRFVILLWSKKRGSTRKNSPQPLTKINTGSNNALSKWAKAVRPPANDTSRSREGPPKKIPIRIMTSIERLGCVRL
jgi:hypothetical protein